MKSIISALLVAALAAACAPANRDTAGTDTTKTGASSSTAAAYSATTSSSLSNPVNNTMTAPAPPAAEENRPMDYYKDKVAELHTSAGEIDIRFYPEVAPGHVKNFIDLAEKGFYNGTKFHRVIPGFMIQGGDPNTVSGTPATWGTGGSGKNIAAEFNNISHVRGIVSMARSNDPNSASSQFFIVTSDSKFLDNNYTVFGKVTKGMAVADKIVNAPRGANDRPNEPTTIEKVVIRAAKPDEQGPAPTGGR